MWDLETERLWEQLFAFINSVDTVLDQDGVQVHDPRTGRPLMSLVQGVLQTCSSVVSLYWPEEASGWRCATTLTSAPVS